MTTIRLRAAIAATLTVLVTSPVLATAPAQAAGGEVIREGSCARTTDWKLKAKHRDGRLEVELEIDSNRRGQTWYWSLRHNGSLSARGRAETRGPSGSFSRERTMVNLRGTDWIRLYARNLRSGEQCWGRLAI